MDDQLVTIKSFSLPWEADLARATLEAQGIPAVVADAHTVSMNWLWSNAIGGVKLQVPEKFIEAATKALAFRPEPSPSDSQEEIDAPTCPRCGNRNSTIIRLGRRWTFLTWLLFDIPLFFPPKRCKCLKCGEVWKPTISVSRL